MEFSQLTNWIPAFAEMTAHKIKCHGVVVLFRDIIVCFGCLDSVPEIPEVFSPAVTDDCGTPQAFVLSVKNALTTLTGISLLRVPGVLRQILRNGKNRQFQGTPAQTGEHPAALCVWAGAVQIISP